MDTQILYNMSITNRGDITLDFKIEAVVQHHVDELLEYMSEQCPDELYDILTGNYQITLQDTGPVKSEFKFTLDFTYIPSKRDIEQFTHLMEGRGGLWNNKLFAEGSPWFPSCLPKDIYCYLLYMGNKSGVTENTWKTIDQIDKYWYYHLNALAFENPEEYDELLFEFNSRYEEWRQVRLEAEEAAIRELKISTRPQHSPKSLIQAFHLYSNKKYYRGLPVPSSWTITRRGFKNKIDNAIHTGDLSSLEDIVDYNYMSESFPLGLPIRGKLTNGSYRILEFYMTKSYRELSLYLRSISIPVNKTSKKIRNENVELPGVQTVHSFCGHKTVYRIPEDLNQVLPGGVKLMSILMAYPRSDPMVIIKQGITEEILAKRNSSLGYSRDPNKELYYCLQIPERKNPRYQYVSILPQNRQARRSQPVSSSSSVSPVLPPTSSLSSVLPPVSSSSSVSTIRSALPSASIQQRVSTIRGPMRICTKKYDLTDFSSLYGDSTPTKYEKVVNNIMNTRKQQCVELNQMFHAISLVYKMGSYEECEIFKSHLGNLDDLSLLSDIKSGKLCIPSYQNGKFNPQVVLPGYNTIVPHQHVNYSVPTFQAITPLESHDQLQKICEYKRYASNKNHYIYTKRKKYTCMIYKHGLSHWTGTFVNVKDMIDLFTHVNYLDQVILQSILDRNSYTLPIVDSTSSESEEEEEEEEEAWIPEIPLFGLVPFSSVSAIPSVAPVVVSAVPSVALPSVSNPTSVALPSTPPIVVSPIVYQSTIRNSELIQVCGGLAIRRCDLNLYNQILEKLKYTKDRKCTRTVSKFMKYVIVFDCQTSIPIYRVYENGTAVLYDPIYPVPNSNFLWISEHERTQGEKNDTRLSLQKCKKVPGLYYPKMSGEFVLTEMSARLEIEMKDERIYAYNMILKHREPGVVYDKTIDSEISKLVSQTIASPKIIVEPEYIYNQTTGLVCAAIILDYIVPCLSIYKHSRACSNTVALVNDGIPFPGKKTIFFPTEFKGYKVRIPTTEEQLLMKQKWDENALILDSIRQAHYMYILTLGSKFLHRLQVDEVNWEYVNDYFLRKKTASNILYAVYTEMMSEYQKELYIDIPQVEVSSEMIDNYFRYLPTNYTQFEHGVPHNLNEYISQQKKILSCKTIEAARAYISTIALDSKKHKDYVETDTERILKEAKKRAIAKKRRSHVVIAPGPTADGFSCSVSGLDLKSDPYVMCSTTQYMPAGILSDQDIPVSTTETYNSGKWTDINSTAYIPGIPENKSLTPNKDVYMVSEEELLSGRRSFHRKSIYPKVCQSLIEQGWIHPCERLIDRDDGLIFTTEEDIYIAFHGDYDLQIPDPKYLLYLCTVEEILYYYRSDFNVDIHRPRSDLLEEIPKFSSRYKKIAMSKREYLKRYAINCFLHKLYYVHTVLNIIRTDSLRLGMMGVKYMVIPGSTTVAMHGSITKTAYHAQTIFTSKPTIPYSSADTTILYQIYREVTVMTQSGIISHYIGMMHNVKSDVLSLGYKSPEVYTHPGEIMLDIWYSDNPLPSILDMCKLPLSTDKCLYYFTREHLRLITVLSPYERYQLFLYYYKRMGDYLAELSSRIPGQTIIEKNIELVIDAAIIYSLKQIYALEAAAISICQDPSTIRQRNYSLSLEEEYVREILDKKRTCQRSGVKFSLSICTSSLAQAERNRMKCSELRSTWERKLEQDQQYMNTQVNYYRKYLISIYKDNTKISEIAKSIKSDATVIEDLTEDLYQRIAETLPDQIPKSHWNKYYGYDVKSLERVYHRYLSECLHKEDVVLSHDLMMKLIDINETELLEIDNSVYIQSKRFVCPLTDWVPDYKKETSAVLQKIISNPYEYLKQNSCTIDEFCLHRGKTSINILEGKSKFQPKYWKSVLASTNTTCFHVHQSIDDKMYIYYHNGTPLYLLPKETISHLPSTMIRNLPLEIQNYTSMIDNTVHLVETPRSDKKMNIEEIERVPSYIVPRTRRVDTIRLIHDTLPEAVKVEVEVEVDMRESIEMDIQKLQVEKNWIQILSRPVLRSRDENANSTYDVSGLKWNGSYLGKFPKMVILNTIKFEKLDIVELLLPLIDRDGTLHHYNVQCLMFNVKNKLGALMDEMAPNFGLQRIGTHTLTIQNSLCLIYRIEHIRPLTLYGLKDFKSYSKEFRSMLEKIVIYQNYCIHPLEGKYIMVCNGRLAALLPKCMSNTRKTDFKYLVSDSGYIPNPRVSDCITMERKASNLTPDCLEYIPTIVANIRKSTFVV